MTSRFDAATAIEPVGSGVYRADLQEGWGVWETLNGGYVTATVARAMTKAAGRPDPLTVTTHFLRPAQPGILDITTTVKMAGRRVTRVEAAASQGGKEIVAMLGGFTDLDQAPGDLAVVGHPPELPLPDECAVADRARTENATVANRIDARFHPDDAAWSHDRPSGTMTMRAWLRFADERPVDAIGLLFLADSLPPPLFNSGLDVSWVPTIEMTTHVRRTPAPGWLRFSARSRYATAGLIEEDVEIWDAADRLVAQSRQLALLPAT